MIKTIGQKKIWTLTAVFALTFQSAVFAAAVEHPWVLKKDENGIQVFVRKVDGSQLLEYKSRIVVDVPLSEVVRLYEEKDNGRMPEWFYMCKDVKLLETKSPDEKIYYFVFDMPTPVTDRDLVYRRERVTDPSGKTVEYKVHELSGVMPDQKGKVRMPSINSYWRLKSLEDGRTEVYYQQHSEIGGFIPSWLVNLLAVNIPFNTLTNFSRLLDEEKAKKQPAA